MSQARSASPACPDNGTPVSDTPTISRKEGIRSVNAQGLELTLAGAGFLTVLMLFFRPARQCPRPLPQPQRLAGPPWRRRHRASRNSLAQCMEAALHAIAALDSPPTAKTNRKAAPATGHSRMRQIDASWDGNCSPGSSRPKRNRAPRKRLPSSRRSSIEPRKITVKSALRAVESAFLDAVAADESS